MDARRFILEFSTGSSDLLDTPSSRRNCCSRSRCNSLSALGVYQEGIAKNMVDNKVSQSRFCCRLPLIVSDLQPVVSHLYEYTTQLSIDPQLTFKGLEKGIVPVRRFHCPQGAVLIRSSCSVN